MTELESIIEQTTGYKNSRQSTADYMLARPELLDLFLFSCFEIDNPNHYKACWAMELMAYEKLEWFQPYLDLICSKSQKLTNESAIRPIAKVLYLLLEAHYKKTDDRITLTEEQRQDLIETNFDWLINDAKVAAKVYAMRCLYLLGNEYDWIHPELKTILVKDFSTHTAAYKAVSKHILKKLK
ncbi:hypothetical protein SLW70_06035 [Flavobacterium sp. NG2]|uniref:hypothetical protein n=1 Tax=Flavobacterium sp. NG2 TaxID=3097547 RepID=UPI002A807514|nr:hypothetical protein [Flavobacterium sp. NG2]WPR72687.1 hypothetical protein SLW70_06035 [Flavobacterium sp. NG2]